MHDVRASGLSLCARGASALIPAHQIALEDVSNGALHPPASQCKGKAAAPIKTDPRPPLALESGAPVGPQVKTEGATAASLGPAAQEPLQDLRVGLGEEAGAAGGSTSSDALYEDSQATEEPAVEEEALQERWRKDLPEQLRGARTRVAPEVVVVDSETSAGDDSDDETESGIDATDAGSDSDYSDTPLTAQGASKHKRVAPPPSGGPQKRTRAIGGAGEPTGAAVRARGVTGAGAEASTRSNRSTGR